MESYLAVVKTENNRIAKYQDFSIKSEADNHTATYGGFTVSTPETGDIKYWVVDSAAKTLTHDSATQTSEEATAATLRAILNLESQVTNRRLREAYADSTWLDAQEALIATERAKL